MINVQRGPGRASCAYGTGRAEARGGVRPERGTPMSRISLVCACVLSLPFGCNSLTGVNDLDVADQGASGSGGSAGATGGTGGSSGQNGGSGGGGDCPPGQKPCDQTCVPFDDPAYGCTETGCEPCELPNAVARCDGPVCEVDTCEPDWLDCDSDEAGCETPLDDENPCTENDCNRTLLEPGTPCDGESYCDEEGRCVCDHGTTRCDGNTPQECTSTGEWVSVAACPPAAPVCSRGACSRVTQVVAGAGHTCASLEDRTTRCWGNNERGQLGIGTAGGAAPTPVPTMADHVVFLTARGDHTCAIGEDQALRCWGDNSHAQLGIGTLGGVMPVPAEVDVISGVVTAATGETFTCAAGSVSNVGALYCWGDNSLGQLGVGIGLPSTDIPTDRVLGLTSQNLEALCAGQAHACAALGDGNLQCWGSNAYNQLGSASAGGVEGTPVSTKPLDYPYWVSCGAFHTCARDLNGAFCWGSGVAGQVGRGIGAGSVDPAVVGDYDFVTAGGQHTCAYSTTNDALRLWCWGRNNHGQLGLGHDGDVGLPTMVEGLPVFLDHGPLALGGTAGVEPSDVPERAHTCVLGNDSVVWCWGSNDFGQLGTGDTTPSAVPVRVVW